MLNVLANILFGLAALVTSPVEENNDDGEFDVTMADPNDEDGELSLPSNDEGVVPRDWECLYGDDRHELNYCLVMCDRTFGYEKALPNPVRDTPRQRKACRRAGRSLCSSRGEGLESVCWGDWL